MKPLLFVHLVQKTFKIPTCKYIVVEEDEKCLVHVQLLWLCNMICDCCPHSTRFPEQEHRLRMKQQRKRQESEVNDFMLLCFNNMQMNTDCSFTLAFVHTPSNSPNSILFSFLLYALIYKWIHFSCFLLQTSVCLLNFLYTSCCEDASQTFVLRSDVLLAPVFISTFAFLFLQWHMGL